MGGSVVGSGYLPFESDSARLDELADSVVIQGRALS